MDKVITISREFGSGGRELGIRLSKQLGIPFYDKELITLAAENCNMPETAVLNHDESLPEVGDRQNYSPFSSVYEVSMSDQIFIAQSRLIQQLAKEGPCVIVGRCADMVLEDSINIFLYSKLKYRIQRMTEIIAGVEAKEMEVKIREIDRKRRDYYQYYTGNEWGRAQNYHLCLDSHFAGLDVCLHTVMSYLDKMI